MSGPGRPVDIAKREAVLEAARMLIRAKGMALTIDDVASAAGVARQTVYNAFGGKAELIAAVVTHSVSALVQTLEDPVLAQEPREALLAFGQRYADLMFAPESLALLRLLIAQGDQASAYIGLFFQSGPQLAYSRLRAFLRARWPAGPCEEAALDAAVDQFFGMLRGTAHFSALMGVIKPPEGAARSRQVKDAVDAFLRAYPL